MKPESPKAMSKEQGTGMRRIFGTRRCTDPECVGQMMLKGIRQTKKSPPKTEHLWICKVCGREEWETQIGPDLADVK